MRIHPRVIGVLALAVVSWVIAGTDEEPATAGTTTRAGAAEKAS